MYSEVTRLIQVTFNLHNEVKMWWPLASRHPCVRHTHFKISMFLYQGKLDINGSLFFSWRVHTLLLCWCRVHGRSEKMRGNLTWPKSFRFGLSCTAQPPTRPPSRLKRGGPRIYFDVLNARGTEPTLATPIETWRKLSGLTMPLCSRFQRWHLWSGTGQDVIGRLNAVSAF